jgi:hypothetical protein
VSVTEPTIAPSAPALAEALALSSVILEDLELSKLPLTNIAMKTIRLSRLLNDFEMASIFEFEVSGYPITPDGLRADLFLLAQKAGRGFQRKEKEEIKSFVYATSIAELAQSITAADSALGAARDPDISISSANPSQYVWNPTGNSKERQAIRSSQTEASRRLAGRQALIYSYVVTKHYELKYSTISGDVFSRQRERVDGSLGKYIPKAIKQFSAVYENLLSNNTEDWSNAVHSCRRVLQELADSIFPPADSITKIIDGKERKIALGSDQYINRLIAFCESHSNSKRFQEIVGSNLSYMGERLDAVFAAAQKGSHSDIVDREEADRYVVYTYLVVGDILSLLETKPSDSALFPSSETPTDLTE